MSGMSGCHLCVSTWIIKLSRAYSDLKTHGLDLTSFWQKHLGKLTFYEPKVMGGGWFR